MIWRWVDIVILAVVAIMFIRGFLRGFVRELFSLLGMAAAIWIAYNGYEGLAVRIKLLYPLDDWVAQLVAFIFLAATVGLASVALGLIVSRIIKLTPFAFVDRLAGGSFGVLKTLLLLLAVVAFLTTLPLEVVGDIFQESAFAREMRSLLPAVSQQIEILWPEGWARPHWLFPIEQEPDIGPSVLLQHQYGV